MHLKRTRLLIVTLVALTTRMYATTHIASIYLESLDAFQKQVLGAAQSYQIPALAALPLFLPRFIPGGGELLAQNKPLAVHALQLADGKQKGVLEITVPGDLQAFLRNVAGLDNNVPIPAPTDGIYRFPDKKLAIFAFKNRLFLTREVEEADQFLGDYLADCPTMPAMPGTIRISLWSAGLNSLSERVTQNVQINGAAAGHNQTLDGIAKYYNTWFKQIVAIHIGLDLQEQGVFSRLRVIPQAESDLAAIIASRKPLNEKQLGFITPQALYCTAEGGFEIPPRVLEEFHKFYATILQPLLKEEPNGQPTVDNAIKAAFTQQNVPMAWLMQLSPTGQLLAQGIAQPADTKKFFEGGIINSQLSFLTKFPGLQHLAAANIEPTTLFGMQVVRLPLNIDLENIDLKAQAHVAIGNVAEIDDQMAEIIEARVAEAQKKQLEQIAHLVQGEYAMGRTDTEVFFSLGNIEQLEQAQRRFQAPKTAEAQRLLDLLKPSGAPVVLSRLALHEIISKFMINNNKQWTEALLALPPGDAVMSAHWVRNQEYLIATLFPAKEIKALFELGTLFQKNMVRENRHDIPQRPPVPEDF